MAHEIGKSDTMFSVGETPWHQLGTVVKEAPTTAEAIKLAGLDWQAVEQGLWLYDETKNEDEAATPIDMSEAKAIVRSTDGALLGVVGGRYTPVQNAEAFAWFDPILKAGEATLETAGSLRDGKRVWILAKIGHNGDSHAEIVPGDEIRRYWLLANAHDGSMAVRVGRSTTRVVCANTLAAALGEGQTLRVRHTASALQTLDEIRDVMRRDEQAFFADVEAFRALARTPVTAKTLREYVAKVWPDSFKPKKETKADRIARERAEARAAADRRRLDVEANRAAGKSLLDSLLGGDDAPTASAQPFAAESDELMSEILDRVTDHFESGRGAKIPGVRGTMWGLYNAAAEYLQYEHGRGPEGVTDRRMDSMAFGASATKNALALQSALEFAQYGKGGR